MVTQHIKHTSEVHRPNATRTYTFLDAFVCVS